MAKTLKYFHVTSYKSYKLILTEGLKSYDGIFLLSNKSWKDDSKEIISLKELVLIILGMEEENFLIN